MSQAQVLTDKISLTIRVITTIDIFRRMIELMTIEMFRSRIALPAPLVLTLKLFLRIDFGSPPTLLGRRVIRIKASWTDTSTLECRSAITIQPMLGLSDWLLLFRHCDREGLKQGLLMLLGQVGGVSVNGTQVGITGYSVVCPRRSTPGYASRLPRILASDQSRLLLILANAFSVV
jgi:hypothetical protein